MTPEQHIAQLEQRIQKLESQLKQFVYPSSYRFTRPVLAGPDGLRLLSGTSDKLGFYGAQPVVRYDGVTFNGVPGATYGAPEQAILAGLRTALLYYNLIKSV